MYQNSAQESCLQTNDVNGLPIFQPYGSGPSMRIQHQHQAIIPSYRFNCSGNIAEWGVDLNPDGTFAVFLFILQIWRPLQNVSGCYTLVNHTTIFATTTMNRRLVVVTPSLVQHQLQFQLGDVLGFYVESQNGISDHDNGVVLLTGSNYTSESVWHARIDLTAQTSEYGNCSYPVGTAGVLNTLTHAAPVISISIMTYSHPQSSSTMRASIIPTSLISTLIPSPHSLSTISNTMTGSVSDAGGMIIGASVTVIVVIVCIIVVTVTAAFVIKKYSVMEKIIHAAGSSGTVALHSDHRYSKSAH